MLAAARVGGILANDRYPADFLSDNLAIEQSVIQAAYETGVDRLVFLGSTCIYPKHAPQPMPEDSLLTGPLEPTNQWYAVAKIAGVKLCEALLPPARLRRDQPDADEPLRPPRQLRPEDEPRPARPASQVSRGERRRPRRPRRPGDPLGLGHAPARVPLRGGPRRCDPVRLGARRRRRSAT